jgi:lipopolysaccharide transport system ATP-binding protein
MAASKKENPIIEVKHLSKQYNIGVDRTYKTFCDSFTSSVRHPLKTLKDRHKLNNTFWALKDVNFEIKQGDAVGIIGRNGAGKSTLLKILSRITSPTEGEITMRGRVGSLLEVGTGFHPELTGRENIYFNGAILGMKKREIDHKFEEIVKFSGIEKFLDTPVKRYSSGMQVRLAFSVAANLDPEILIVDEVLAVGDAEFQKKCMGKMNEVTEGGRTVLFVSHNMGTIQNLCDYGIVLESGKILFQGEIQEAISDYFQGITLKKQTELIDRKDRVGDQLIKFSKILFFDSNGNEIETIISGEDLYIKIYYTSKREINNALIDISISVKTPLGYPLTDINSVDSGNQNMHIYRKGCFVCKWPKLSFRTGNYDCNLFCSINNDIADWIQSAFTLHVIDGDYFGTGRLVNRAQGDILVSYSWESKGSKT